VAAGATEAAADGAAAAGGAVGSAANVITEKSRQIKTDKIVDSIFFIVSPCGTEQQLMAYFRAADYTKFKALSTGSGRPKP
jgi:hypothetical protein